MPKRPIVHSPAPWRNCGQHWAALVAIGFSGAQMTAELSTDQMRAAWPVLLGYVLGNATHFNDTGNPISAQALRVAAELATRYLSLLDAVRPGKPVWQPTEAQPQQDFFEAVAESLHASEKDKQRFERALRAIRDSKLCGADFGDWVQSVCEDVLEGCEAQCSECGTVVHEGPCVGEEPKQ